VTQISKQTVMTTGNTDPQQLAKRIIVAGVIEAIVIALLFVFLPVELQENGHRHTVFAFSALKSPDAQINSLFLAGEVLCVVFISSIAILFMAFTATGKDKKG